MVDLYAMVFILDIVFLGIQLCDARCRRGCINNIKDRHEEMRRTLANKKRRLWRGLQMAKQR
jgi:hypothetical protein